MKNSKSLMFIYALTFVFVVTGATFAYFSQTATSGEGAMGAKSTNEGIQLIASPLFTDKKLIPLNDEEVDDRHDDVLTAYANECVDIKGYGACKAYTITVTNIGPALDYVGTIKFTLSNIANLKYLVLDDNDDIYVNKTVVDAGTDQPLGSITPLGVGETKTFTLLMWVPNRNYSQDDYDGGGEFSAIITYKSTANTEVSGSISGS